MCHKKDILNAIIKLNICINTYCKGVIVGNNIFSRWVQVEYGDFKSFKNCVVKGTQFINIWEIFDEKGPEFFYSDSLINVRDKVGVDLDGMIDTEKISQWLLTPIVDVEKNICKRPIDFWEDIKPLRNKPYFTANHNETKNFYLYAKDKGCQNEQNLAKLLYLNDFLPELDNIIDYQVPLRGKLSDKIGAIDLVSYSEDRKRFSLIELKYNPSGSIESLLRCVLEVYTYFKFLDKERFVADFKKSYPDNLKGDASKRVRLSFDPGAKFELIILFAGGASDISAYINGEDTPLLPLNIHRPTQLKYSRQFIEFKNMRQNPEKTSLYNLCKYIARKEDVVFRFCKLARLEKSSNGSFEIVKFVKDKDKKTPINDDWQIGQYYIQDEFTVDRL